MALQRTGLQQAIKIVRKFCKLYAVWAGTMMAYIDSKTEYTVEQRTAAKNALEAVNTACAALEVFQIFYEG